MKIEYFTEPKKFINELKYCSQEIHVCITSELEQYFKNIVFPEHKMNIVLFKDLGDVLYPNWNNTIEKIRMNSILRDIIEKLEIEEYEKFSYLKDIDNILLLIRYISEVGVKDIDLAAVENDAYLSKREKVIMNIYAQFIADTKVSEYLKEFNHPINSKMFAEKLEYFNSSRKGISGSLDSVKKIYIYNNATLNIRDNLLLKKLSMRGIEIVYRIYFTKEIAYNCPNMEKLFLENFNETELPSKVIKSNLIKYLAGDDIVQNINEDIEYTIFDNPSKFKQYIREFPLAKEHTYSGEVSRHYVAAAASVYNDYFKDVVYDKEKLSLNNMFLYQEGNFLVNLYNIKIIDDEYYIDFNDLFRCITSGWIEIKSGSKYISGKRAASLLIDIQEYLTGCNTLNDFISRIDTLELLIEFRKKFDEIGESKADKDKVKQYLSNPLKVFTFLNSNRYEVTVKQLRELINKFKKIVMQLLPDDMLDVNMHISAIKSLWNELSFNNEEDKKELPFINISDKLPLIGEEYELLSFFEMRSLLIALTVNKSEDDGTDINIKYLYALEGIILEDVKEINMVDLTEGSLESITDDNTIPKGLDIVYLEKWIEYSSLNNRVYHKALEIHKLWEASLKDIVTYNLAMLFENYKGKINIFYVKNIFENDAPASIYNIIKNIYQCNEEKYSGDVISYFDFMTEEQEIEKLEHKEITWKDDLAPTAFLDLDFCSRKFFLSNIVLQNPIYTTEIHQQMAFTTLGNLFSCNKEQQKNNIFFKLFPQWTDTLKENLMETSFDRDINKRYTFKNINFPYYMKDMQILRSKYGAYSKVKNAYKEKRIKSNEYIKEFMKDVKYNSIEARSGSHCTMCPYQYICTKGEWAIDRANY